jgi:hypothetical protein
MTVEHDSLTRLTNKILIVDDHPYYSRIQECITTRYQPRKYEFHIWKPKIVSQPII